MARRHLPKARGLRRALASFFALGLAASVWTGVVPSRARASGMTWTAQTSGTNDTLYDVAYHGGTYVAVGENGTILTSSNGASWQSQTSNTTAILNSVTFGASEWVAVGHGGVADVSPNASTWTASVFDPLQGIFEEILYAGGTYFAADWGRIFTSADAATWSGQTLAGAPTIYGAAYTAAGGGTVVGVGDAVVTTSASSPTSWTVQTSSLPTLFAVADGAGLLVAVGKQGAVYTSSDGGVTWSDHSIALAQDTNLYDVAYDECGVFVAVGAGGAIYSSSDGANWSAESSGTNAALYGVRAGGGLFVAVGAGGTILTAPSPCARPSGPDLAIAKTRLGPAVAGQPVSYQIVVSNAGTAPMTGWIGVSDPLPTGLTSVSVSAAPPWSCTTSGNTVMCTYNGGAGFALAPGQSLPPVTVTGTVAPGVATLENCARVVAQNMAQDTDPDDNFGCDKTDVAVGEGGGGGEQTALLCVLKFLDADGDGVQDANEPGLPNWTFTLYDSSGHPMASGHTGQKGRICKKLAPGTYTVGEAAQPGWVQTAPQPVPPGTATVTLSAGQTVVLAFGNRPTKERCCLDFRETAGRADGFSVADGPEPSTPPPGRPAGAFDATSANQALWQRLTLPEGNCLTSAQLVVRLRPLFVPDSVNDRIYLYAGSASWVANLGTGSGNAGGSALSPSPWDAAHQGGGQVLTLDLSALPTPVGSQNLLFALDAARILDVAVQDDTSVDSIELDVTFCECAPGQEPNAAAGPGAGEVHMKIGEPVILTDGVDRPLDVPPVVRDGRTFVPLRALAESMGFAVSWDPGERKATIASPDRTVEVWVGRNTATVLDTQAVFLGEGTALSGTPAPQVLPIDPQNPSVMPFIEGGRVMVPLRFVAEAMGFDVAFDGAQRAIDITCRYPYCVVPPTP